MHEADRKNAVILLDRFKDVWGGRSPLKRQHQINLPMHL